MSDEMHVEGTTARGLLRATLGAALAGGALLVFFWLPAEYGIDPTGMGRLTGLTRMGEIKQGLRPASPENQHLAEIAARLDRIEAKLDALDAAPPVAEAGDETGWRDSFSYPLAPGQGVEVKLVMEAGASAEYAWQAEGGGLYHDTHGDNAEQEHSYEQGSDVQGKAGLLTAAFTGNHGWWWQNRSAAPVTVTVHTSGDYARMLHP